MVSMVSMESFGRRRRYDKIDDIRWRAMLIEKRFAVVMDLTLWLV